MARQADGYFYHEEQFEDPSNPLRLPGQPRVFQADTMTCGHCQSVVILNPERKRGRGRCWRCDTYLCDVCHEVYGRRGECFTEARTMDLAFQFPERGVSIGRPGIGRRAGLPTDAELRLIEDTRIYPSGSPQGRVSEQGGFVPAAEEGTE